jgi:hypothetical protein
MADTNDAADRRAPLEDVVRFFGSHWAGFWAWLDGLARNAQPMPSASRKPTKGSAERNRPSVR